MRQVEGLHDADDDDGGDPVAVRGVVVQQQLQRAKGDAHRCKGIGGVQVRPACVDPLQVKPLFQLMGQLQKASWWGIVHVNVC